MMKINSIYDFLHSDRAVRRGNLDSEQNHMVMATNNRTFRDFHHSLSWSTRIYTLVTIVVAAGAFLFNAWTTNWAFTMIAAIAIVLFVETFALSLQRHPKTWRVIRMVLLLLLLSLLLIGFLSPAL
jgi:hypothetical protein